MVKKNVGGFEFERTLFRSVRPKGSCRVCGLLSSLLIDQLTAISLSVHDDIVAGGLIGETHAGNYRFVEEDHHLGATFSYFVRSKIRSLEGEPTCLVIMLCFTYYCEKPSSFSHIPALFVSARMNERWRWKSDCDAVRRGCGESIVHRSVSDRCGLLCCAPCVGHCENTSDGTSLLSGCPLPGSVRERPSDFLDRYRSAQISAANNFYARE